MGLGWSHEILFKFYFGFLFAVTPVTLSVTSSKGHFAVSQIPVLGEQGGHMECGTLGSRQELERSEGTT